MQQPPDWVLASWPTPNYDNPETHGWKNVILNIVLYTILCCFMSVRMWTRTKLRASFGADDIMILCAMIPTTGFFVLSLLADTKFMWTRHQYDIPESNVETGLKMVLMIEIMFASACTFTKLSMLMLVRRMLSGASLLWRRITFTAICVVTLQGSLFCIVLVFQCRPPQDYWKVTLEPQPNCIDQSSTLLLAGIVNTLTDFLAVLLPIRTVYSTNLPRRQCLIISFLFILGLLSCFAGIVRTYYMYVVTKVWDQVWASYPVWVSAAVELYIGIICTSIPATKTFFATYIPLLFNSHPSRSSRTSRSLGRLAYHHHNSPENHNHNPGFNLNFNSKSHQNSAPRLGIASTTKSNLKSHSHSESSMTPLSAATSFPDRDSIGSRMEDGDMRFFGLSTVTNSIRGGVHENTNEKSKMDEEIGFKSGVGVAVGSTSIASSNSMSSTDLNTNLDKLQKAHNNSISSSNINTIKRGFIGSMRREREPGNSRGCSRGQDKDRERKRGTDRDWETENTSTSTPMDEESRRQGGSLDGSIEREKVREREREKEGGWDIHIDVVKTIEVEVEMEEEYLEEELYR